jgi:hypothetical protein
MSQTFICLLFNALPIFTLHNNTTKWEICIASVNKWGLDAQGAWATSPGSCFWETWKPQSGYKGRVWKARQLTTHATSMYLGLENKTSSQKKVVVLKYLFWDREWDNIESSPWYSGGKHKVRRKNEPYLCIKRTFLYQKKKPRRSVRRLKVSSWRHCALYRSHRRSEGFAK